MLVASGGGGRKEGAQKRSSAVSLSHSSKNAGLFVLDFKQQF